MEGHHLACLLLVPATGADENVLLAAGEEAMLGGLEAMLGGPVGEFERLMGTGQMLESMN